MTFRTSLLALALITTSGAAYAADATAPQNNKPVDAAAATQPDVKAKETVSKMVPDSKVVKVDGDEYELLTPKQTLVEVELNRDGTIDEASGKSAVGGDAFEPGNGLMSLSGAIAALKQAGKTPSGEWSFEKSYRHDWIYEFEGRENGKEMEYAVSAKDGKLVKDRRDLL